ncbi:uncharacterized protein B0I36DRAFT_334977 [Microdochium trichocladiopsis]|uniref:P-loop containing nucleoside triphosphate hydrolase protein n=1 Tax=Microdochium trichocladiopsis TaxID=1682393 RepID=A0A9P8XXA4_9PEZI|nr:uncharacterized protein B0I36DRAFT_334977 [Microdochium trichocladiopsis]KAH7021637.1 hypothetical protein B0I36DRAFT_334977 [Microdochium trichocladiopsis]
MALSCACNHLGMQRSSGRGPASFTFFSVPSLLAAEPFLQSTIMAKSALRPNQKRICIIGSPLAGKTQLAKRFSGQDFDKTYTPTRKKTPTLLPNNIELLEFPGLTGDTTIKTTLEEMAHSQTVVIIVYDPTYPPSLRLHTNILKTLPHKNVMIVGTRSGESEEPDRRSTDTRAEAEETSRKYEVSHFPTSLMTGSGFAQVRAEAFRLLGVNYTDASSGSEKDTSDGNEISHKGVQTDCQPTEPATADSLMKDTRLEGLCDEEARDMPSVKMVPVRCCCCSVALLCREIGDVCMAWIGRGQAWLASLFRRSRSRAHRNGAQRPKSTNRLLEEKHASVSYGGTADAESVTPWTPM